MTRANLKRTLRKHIAMKRPRGVHLGRTPEGEALLSYDVHNDEHYEYVCAAEKVAEKQGFTLWIGTT